LVLSCLTTGYGNFINCQGFWEDNVGKVFNALKKAGEETAVTREADPVAPEQHPAANEKKVKLSRQHSSEGKKEKKAAPLMAPMIVERGDWDERLILATALTGPVAESFRTLRTRILHLASGKPVKNVLVTSAASGEGKSFVCANLGLSFAQGMDHHGLLVDCDLRKPSLGKLFGLSNERGLVNYLRDNEELSSLITDVGVEKLRIIPAGPPAVNPAELLGSETMEELIKELEQAGASTLSLLSSCLAGRKLLELFLMLINPIY
jgi:Mrp family chromosome partitioning ATPase